MKTLNRWLSTLACGLVLVACGGGGDPFYREPAGGGAGGGGSAPPIFGAAEPIVRPPITSWPAPVRQAPKGPKVLVLYDEPLDSEYAKLGLGNAILLQNLLGHFDAAVELRPTQQYTAGLVSQFDTTFYVGWATGAGLPDAFLEDVSTRKPRIVWMRGNLQKLADREGPRFQRDRGFATVDSRWFDDGPTPEGQVPSFFSRVFYKNLPFDKLARVVDGQVVADAEVFITEVMDRSRVSVHAVIGNPATGETAPYALQSGNFWFLADIPFNYPTPTDRYVVFADLLHDMLGIDHPEIHRAMIRLEDIDAKVSPPAFKPVVDYLFSQNVPFSMAVIPHYKDPYGAQSNGVPTEIPLRDAKTLRLALDYALARGGEILQHGYTHQADNMVNDVSGASGIDFEFWDAVRYAPLPQDSVEWAAQRVHAGLSEFLDLGYRPVAWETPHYQGSPSILRAVTDIYQTAYQRHTYYTSDKPNLKPGMGADFEVWQTFPYIIERDRYGLRVLPENLGNLQYFQYGVNEEYTAETILQGARYAKVIRDGFASFFFHPFLVEGTEGRGLQDLRDIVEGLQEMGYTWTSPSRLSGQ